MIKISLDEAAGEALNSMFRIIKEQSPEAMISPSSLASWIINQFLESGFEKAKDKITSHHFNPKAYLRKKLKDLNSVEEVESVLVEIRSKIKNQKGKPERKDCGESGPVGT